MTCCSAAAMLLQCCIAASTTCCTAWFLYTTDTGLYGACLQTIALNNLSYTVVMSSKKANGETKKLLDGLKGVTLLPGGDHDGPDGRERLGQVKATNLLIRSLFLCDQK
jgi:hypothetical protein